MWSHLMSWAARKLCGSDWEDPQQVVTDYLLARAAKQLKEFWTEYDQETHDAGDA